MSHEFTYIDVGGNQARYVVSEKDHDILFDWATDHGDHGIAASFAEAQSCARTALKGSMAANRRSEEATRQAGYFRRWR